MARLAATAAEVACGDDQLKLPPGVDPEGTVAKELAKPQLKVTDWWAFWYRGLSTPQGRNSVQRVLCIATWLGCHHCGSQ